MQCQFLRNIFIYFFYINDKSNYFRHFWGMLAIFIALLEEGTDLKTGLY